MDELIGNFVKFLSSTVIVRITSYPNFSIETLLATAVCIVHFLLIFEINTLVRRTNAKAAARLKMKRPKDSESCSFHSLVTMKNTQVFRKPELCHRTPVYTPFNPKPPKRFSRSSSFGWMLSKGDSVVRHKFSDRVEHLLSISPSEYVRRDKERKSREKGLRSCIQSLTSLLEKALNNKQVELKDMSEEDYIEKSLNALRDNFETQIRDDSLLMEVVSPSMQDMMERNKTRQLLRKSVCPDELMSALYQSPDINLSKSNFDIKTKKRTAKDNKDSRRDNLSAKSSRSLSEIFRKHSTHGFEHDHKISPVMGH